MKIYNTKIKAELFHDVFNLLLFQELVREFNFHRYDNLKHAANKKDPRRHKFETKGLSIVNLLFSAASGDVTAMRRYNIFNSNL